MTSDEFCIECENTDIVTGYSISCVECEDEYELESGKCVWAELPNCKEIDDEDNEKCKKCDDDYYLRLDTYWCVKNCPDDF